MLSGISALHSNSSYLGASLNSSSAMRPPLLGASGDGNAPLSMPRMADEGVGLDLARRQENRGLEPPGLPPLGLDEFQRDIPALPRPTGPIAPEAQAVDLLRRFTDTLAPPSDPLVGGSVNVFA
jgi:hypothetical protein